MTTTPNIWSGATSVADTRDGEQSVGIVGALDNGDTFVVYEDASLGTDPNLDGRIRFFDPAGNVKATLPTIEVLYGSGSLTAVDATQVGSTAYVLTVATSAAGTTSTFVVSSYLPFNGSYDVVPLDSFNVPGEGTVRDASLVVDMAGNVLVTWLQRAGTESGLWANKINADGTETGPFRISDPSGSDGPAFFTSVDAELLDDGSASIGFGYGYESLAGFYENDQSSFKISMGDTETTGTYTGVVSTAREENGGVQDVLADGARVFVWVEGTSIGIGGPASGSSFTIKATIIAENGTRTAPFIASVNDGNDGAYLQAPEVVALEDGGFLVLWSSQPNSATSAPDVRFQRFDAGGTVVGDDGAIPIPNAGEFRNISAELMQDGRVAVAVTNFPQSGSFGSDVFYATLDPRDDGYRLTPEQGAAGAGAVSSGTAFVAFRTEGSNEADTIYGAEGADEIDGRDGDDTIYGGGGKDILSPGLGADILDGGLGLDEIDFTYSPDGWTIDLDAGVATPGTNLFDQAKSLVNIENVTGGLGNDTIVGHARIGNDLDGWNGNNTLDGGDSARLTATEAQIFRMYDSAFDRVPDEAGFDGWVANLAGGMALPTIAQTFVQSAEFAATYGNLSNEDFVEQLYRNILDRSSDPGGKAIWVGYLETGATRGQVLSGFSESAEHIALVARDADAWATSTAKDEHLGEIYRMYDTAFDRAPDTGGFLGWLDSRDGGTSLLDIADSFIQAPEFTARYGQLSDGDFVEQLYVNVLGRASDPGGKQSWLDNLANGMSRGQVVVGFSESAEHVSLTQQGFERMFLESPVAPGQLTNIFNDRFTMSGTLDEFETFVSGRGADDFVIQGGEPFRHFGITTIYGIDDLDALTLVDFGYAVSNRQDFLARLVEDGSDTRFDDPFNQIVFKGVDAAQVAAMDLFLE